MEMLVVLIGILVTCRPSLAQSETTNIHRITTERPNVCVQEECRNVANIYAQTVNKTVPPCVDFYEFACGSSTSEHPENSKDRNRFEPSESNIKNILAEMLSSSPKKSDLECIRFAKKFYQSCMDTANRNATGINTIATILRHLGGWPMASNYEDWARSNYTWQDVDNNFTELSADHTFYSINPWESLSDDSEDQVIMLRQPEVMPEFRENFEEYRSLLRPLVKRFASNNEANISDVQLEDDIHNLWIFEKHLREVKKPEEERMMHVMSLGRWTEDWNYKSRHTIKAAINWKRNIQRLFDARTVDDVWFIHASGPYYWSLIELWNITDERTIVNYIHWKFVSQMLKYTTEEILNELIPRTRPSSKILRRTECLEETKMRYANAYWIVTEYLPVTSPQRVRNMLLHIKHEFIYQINTLGGMDAKGKLGMKNEVRRVKKVLNIPTQYKNRTAIEDHYKGLIIGDDYLANILNFKRFKKLYHIHCFLDGNFYYRKSAATVGLYLPSDLHTYILDIPPVLFQTSIFSTKIPEYMKFATTGVRIAHELASSMRSRDISAMLSPLYDHQEYLRCAFKQASEYAGDALTALSTVFHNSLDIVSIRAALSKYKRLKHSVPKLSNGEVKLPGFQEYTDEQMFFIGFAGGICRRADDIEECHSSVGPPALRILNAVYNIPEFAEAFQCPLGSPMNPMTKCTEGLDEEPNTSDKML